MKPFSEDLLIQAFLDALDELAQAPDLDLVVDGLDARPPREVDALIHIDLISQTPHLPDRPITLLVEAKRGGFPRDVRQAVWQLRKCMPNIVRDNAGEVLPVVIAPTISPGAREQLRHERIGYFELGGSLYLPIPGAFILIDRPAAKTAAKAVNAIFSGQRAQVIHAAWVHDEEWFNVRDLADRSLVSTATVSQTLTALEQRDYAESRGSGPAKQRRLTDRTALLDAWAEHQRNGKPPAVRRYYAPQAAAARVFEALDAAAEGAGVAYEVTGAAAGNLHTPFLTQVSQLLCRVEARGAATVLEVIDARPVREGWNLVIMDAETPSAFAFRQRGEYGWIADPLQTYLDLLQEGGRSKDLAEELRVQKLAA